MSPLWATPAVNEPRRISVRFSLEGQHCATCASIHINSEEMDSALSLEESPRYLFSDENHCGVEDLPFVTLAFTMLLLPSARHASVSRRDEELLTLDLGIAFGL